MVGDCAVLLIEGKLYPIVYHLADEYQYSAMKYETNPLSINDITSIASLGSVLVAVSETGSVYCMEYTKHTGKFTSPLLVNFNLLQEDNTYRSTPIASVGLATTAHGMKVYGLPADDLLNPRSKCHIIEATLDGGLSHPRLTNRTLPAGRTSAKIASGKGTFFVLAYDGNGMGFAYQVPTGKDEFGIFKKFKNGALIDVATTKSYSFVAQTSGRVSYAAKDTKTWCEFRLAADISVCKLAAGGSYVLGATSCGRLVLMHPTRNKGECNVLDFDTLDFSNPMNKYKIMDVSNIAAYEDEYALVVAKVRVDEEGERENKKPRAVA